MIPDLISLYMSTKTILHTDSHLQADNFKPSFYKVGDLLMRAAAKTAFDNLKTFQSLNGRRWLTRLLPTRSGSTSQADEKYTKIRIISTVNEIRQTIAYGECTFQWVHQPDGSLTFP